MTFIAYNTWKSVYWKNTLSVVEMKQGEAGGGTIFCVVFFNFGEKSLNFVKGQGKS